MTVEKYELTDLRNGMGIFLDFPDVEESMEIASENILRQMLLSKTQNGNRLPEDVLADYLNAGNDTNIRLKLLIGFSGGSYEKFQRIYKLISPNSKLEDIKKVKDLRYKVANFLLNPNIFDNSVAIPNFIKKGFHLPNNWKELLLDRNYLKSVITQKILAAKYSTSIGDALERKIKQTVYDCQLTCEKANLDIASKKEIDIVIPNKIIPKILIMSSYQLTTSSAQSSKANEQSRIYNNVQEHNRVNNYDGFSKVFFINIIDGGGWLERPRDLEKIWRYSDYCFAYSQLHKLKEFLLLYKKYNQ